MEGEELRGGGVGGKEDVGVEGGKYVTRERGTGAGRALSEAGGERRASRESLRRRRRRRTGEFLLVLNLAPSPRRLKRERRRA